MVSTSTPEGTWGIVYWRDPTSFSKYVPLPEWDSLALSWNAGKIVEGEKVITIISSLYEEPNEGDCYVVLIPKICVEKIVLLVPA